MLHSNRPDRVRWRSRIIWTSILAHLLLAGGSGCIAYRQWRESVLSLRESNPRSSILPGTYRGEVACTVFIRVEDGVSVFDSMETVSDHRAFTFDLLGRPIYEGTLLRTGARSDLTIDRLTIERTVTSVNSSPNQLVITYDAETTIDPESASPIDLSGLVAETLTRLAGNRLRYTLSMFLSQESGSTALASVGVECDDAILWPSLNILSEFTSAWEIAD